MPVFGAWCFAQCILSFHVRNFPCILSTFVVYPCGDFRLSLWPKQRKHGKTMSTLNSKLKFRISRSLARNPEHLNEIKFQGDLRPKPKALEFSNRQDLWKPCPGSPVRTLKLVRSAEALPFR